MTDDTTTPIDTTEGQAPVVSTPAALDALPVGSVVRGDDGHPWEKVYAAFTTRAVWHTVRSHGNYESTAAGLLPATLLHVPGRDLLAEARAEVAELREQRNQAMVALAEARGFMSVWREAEARGVERARVNLAAQVVKAEATAVAEAEARGYERGKRDALTEAAADLPWTYRQQSGLPDHAERLARWLRARAAETPGGAA